MSAAHLRIVRENVVDPLIIAREQRALAWEIFIQPGDRFVFDGLGDIEGPEQIAREAAVNGRLANDKNDQDCD